MPGLRPSPSIIRRVQALFVDRESETEYFVQSVSQQGAKPIYFISGDDRIGKTFLLHRFFLECESKGWPVVLIDFGRPGARFSNYLSILQHVQLALDQKFPNFQRRLAEMPQIPVDLRLTTRSEGGGAGEAGVSTSGGAIVEGNVRTEGGDFVGRDVNNFYLMLEGSQLQESHVVSQVTQAFLEELAAFVGDQPFVFLFDHIGGASEGQGGLESGTRAWFLEEFILPLCEGEQQLANTRFVITQGGPADASLGDLLFGLVHSHTLRGFDDNEAKVFEIYQTYLVEKHGFPAEEINQLFLRFFHQNVGGKPGTMFQVAQSLKS